MDMVGTWGAARLGRELRCKWRSAVQEVRLQWLSQWHFCPMYKYTQNILTPYPVRQWVVDIFFWLQGHALLSEIFYAIHV